jgi:Rieske [2Fe-2S] domain
VKYYQTSPQKCVTKVTQFLPRVSARTISASASGSAKRLYGVSRSRASWRARRGGIDPKNRRTIACSYHGWRFDMDGACVEIPSPREDQQVDLTKIRCGSYPCVERQGVIWVYFPRADETTTSEPPHMPVLADDARPLAAIMEGSSSPPMKPCPRTASLLDKLDAVGRTDAVAHAARRGVINL